VDDGYWCATLLRIYARSSVTQKADLAFHPRRVDGNTLGDFLR